MKTDEQVVSDRDDVEMMKRDHLWPNLTLPLKRRGDTGPETAVLVNPAENGKPWVLLEGTTIFGGISKGRPVEYESAEAIVAAGWVVD